MEKGMVEVQALPFYTIRKTRPPSSLGNLFRVRLNALQLFTSCTPMWSGKVCTPIFLEWEAVHSNIFGVNNFPLQNFSLPWSKQSCTQISLQKFGVHLSSTPKVLECTSSPLQNFWSALQVHSKKFGVHSKSTPKKLKCTKFHSKNVKFLE
jgi:hypothetical protein